MCDQCFRRVEDMKRDIQIRLGQVGMRLVPRVDDGNIGDVRRHILHHVLQTIVVCWPVEVDSIAVRHGCKQRIVEWVERKAQMSDAMTVQRASDEIRNGYTENVRLAPDPSKRFDDLRSPELVVSIATRPNYHCQRVMSLESPYVERIFMGLSESQTRSETIEEARGILVGIVYEFCVAQKALLECIQVRSHADLLNLAELAGVSLVLLLLWLRVLFEPACRRAQCRHHR